MAYHAAFDLDLALALKDQLVAAFSDLEIGPLDGPSVASIKKDQGVYKLFYKELLVYVGKTDSLQKRLGEHLTKIQGRNNISADDMGFKCLYVHKNWTPLAPEESLIKFFKSRGEGQCEWNGNGFGPHDPGRERETTNKHPDGFDAKYPIQYEWPCTWIRPKNWNILELLLSLKANLPFLLRYETAGKKGHYTKGHADQRTAMVNIPKAGMRIDEILGRIANAMPGWQATRFPSHMILYKEDREYKYGEKLTP